MDGLLTQPDGTSINLNIKVGLVHLKKLTHKIFLTNTRSSFSFLALELQKGSQHMCVESPGVHELSFPNSCVSFGSSSVVIDTSNLSV